MDQGTYGSALGIAAYLSLWLMLAMLLWSGRRSRRNSAPRRTWRLAARPAASSDSKTPLASPSIETQPAAWRVGARSLSCALVESAARRSSRAPTEG